MKSRAKKTEPDEKTLATLKKLFADYDKAEKAYDETKAALEKHGATKETLVQKIAEVGGTGPYTHGGRVMTITKREYKSKVTQPDGTEAEVVTSTSWFFRGPKESETIEV